MIKIDKPFGYIEISHTYLSSLVAHAASECFGVAGMAATTPVQGIRRVFSGHTPFDQGVKVRWQDEKLSIDLHIIVTYGVNIAAIVKSIVHKVRYAVEDTTGFPVGKVNVFVDSMKAE